MKKYCSISTPNVFHDVFNILTEIYFINIYGQLKPFSWRKGNSLSKKWPKILSVFKKIIIDFDISEEKIAWYLFTYKPKLLQAKDFGMLVWRVRRSFKDMSVDCLVDIYKEKYKDLNFVVSFNESYTETKQEVKNDLLSILNNLES